MDLKSGYPYWAVKSGLIHSFPKLTRDNSCEVAVIGGGISGALIADELATHGHDVMVLEERDIAWGSTSASTALIQYEIDTHLIDLASMFGDEQAKLAYNSCLVAVESFAAIAARVKGIGFRRMQSVYFASSRSDSITLKEEFLARERTGLPVSWLDREGLSERFGIDAPAAILSRTAAVVDPYRMTYRLLAAWKRRGMPVYDRSRVVDIVVRPRSVQLQTEEGFHVTAKHVVMATGYAAQSLLKQRIARNRSSYAYVTDPIDRTVLGPLRDAMLWETARPYLYMRTTSDGRVIVGGEDDSIDIPARRDARVAKKAHRLAKRVSGMFPRLQARPAFSWAGTFAETADGLPFFGAHRQYGPRVLFAMAYGGNGITYSVLGASILRAAIERKRHALFALFGFARFH
ncbi:FAD-binding oxidoreductase [Pseudoluteimonas lycopersici]|uniref:FAD-binding oxidoreductase n=1 Tax=Pseudoluteimonas lycopersici TaxID=1324796 RepID=A0A516V3N0_9GAMM|nr:FAD-dependent oxidoreductase [Lysobacter lycopersici]QDQ73142.1 FAD-binding oxidoreductase [Lysobacter lycopersici]